MSGVLELYLPPCLLAIELMLVQAMQGFQHNLMFDWDTTFYGLHPRKHVQQFQNPVSNLVMVIVLWSEPKINLTRKGLTAKGRPMFERAFISGERGNFALLPGSVTH